VCTFTLPRQVAGKMKAQAFATALVNHVVLDLVGRDRLIAQITANSCPVSRIDSLNLERLRGERAEAKLN